MSEIETRRPALLLSRMIAPCGINCGVCRLAFGTKSGCHGCRAEEAKPKYCATCGIRNCGERHGRRFCVECPSYPCQRLRRLDARYRSRYRTSLVENLERIRELGLRRFVQIERQRWTCRGCGLLTSVHKAACLYCGRLGRNAGPPSNGEEPDER